MFFSAQNFTKAGRLTAQVVRELPLLNLLLFVVTFAADQYFEYLTQALSDTDQGPWIAQIGEFLFSLIQGFALLLLGGYFLMRLKEKLSWGEFFKRTLAPLTAESLRALTKVLLWTLAFIVPGLIVYCRLSLVPFVVFCDPTYATRPDACARSMELTRSCWIRLSALMAALTAMDTVIELGPNLLRIDDLVIRGVFELSGYIFSLFAFFIMYIIFENLRSAHDSALQPQEI